MAQIIGRLQGGLARAAGDVAGVIGGDVVVVLLGAPCFRFLGDPGAVLLRLLGEPVAVVGADVAAAGLEASVLRL